MKNIDLRHRLFYHKNTQLFGKWFYIIAYNYYCIKEHTFDISKESLQMVKKFHDWNASGDDYDNVILGIQDL